MSKTDYFKILESIGKDEKPSGPNDRILIVDGLNTFIRSFAANPVTNEDGIHVGGMTGFLMSIGYAIRNIKPTRVIICWDGKGGSQRRRKVFENYKANRRVRTRLTRHGNYNSQEDESMAMRNQIMRLTQYLEVPTDFNEWYFICATYNPDVNERGSQADTDIPEYWLNHIVDDGTGTLIPIEFTNYSGYGNRSKVEIISRTDLLRARGFKV